MSNIQTFGNKGYLLKYGERNNTSLICKALATISSSLQSKGVDFNQWESLNSIFADLEFNSFVLDFIKLHLDLIEFNASEEYLYFRLNYEFYKILKNNELNDMELLELDLTHRLLKLINHFHSLNMEKFLELSSSFCEIDIFHEILSILKPYFKLGHYDNKKNKKTPVTNLIDNINNTNDDKSLNNVLKEFEDSMNKQRSLNKIYIDTN